MSQRKSETGATYFRRVIKPYREAHAGAALCRWCPQPVAIKEDGTRARLCPEHLTYERQRVADHRALR